MQHLISVGMDHLSTVALALILQIHTFSLHVNYTCIMYIYIYVMTGKRFLSISFSPLFPCRGAGVMAASGSSGSSLGLRERLHE